MCSQSPCIPQLFFIPGVQPIVFGKMSLASCSLNSNSMEMVGAEIKEALSLLLCSAVLLFPVHLFTPTVPWVNGGDNSSLLWALWWEALLQTDCSQWTLACQGCYKLLYLSLNSVIIDQTMPVITIKYYNYNYKKTRLHPTHLWKMEKSQVQ